MSKIAVPDRLTKAEEQDLLRVMNIFFSPKESSDSEKTPPAAKRRRFNVPEDDDNNDDGDENADQRDSDEDLLERPTAGIALEIQEMELKSAESAQFAADLIIKNARLIATAEKLDGALMQALQEMTDLSKSLKEITKNPNITKDHLLEIIYRLAAAWYRLFERRKAAKKLLVTSDKKTYSLVFKHGQPSFRTSTTMDKWIKEENQLGDDVAAIVEWYKNGEADC